MKLLPAATGADAVPPPDDSVWNPPDWVYVSKHHSASNETWNELLARSSGKYGNGIYKIGRDEVRRIELETVTDRNLGTEIHPRKAPNHERHFWRQMPEAVGASKGERTKYIYVVYHIGGAVHGYPLTRALLKQKGVDA